MFSFRSWQSLQRRPLAQRPATTPAGQAVLIAPAAGKPWRIAAVCVVVAVAAAFAFQGAQRGDFPARGMIGSLLENRPVQHGLAIRGIACAAATFHAALWNPLTWILSFTAEKILWALRLAGLLALLVVLFARRHARRFPWFTASIALSALYMVVERLISWRFSPHVMAWVLVLGHDLMALVGVIVVLELGQRVFERVRQKTRFVGILVMLAVGVGIMTFWGPRPTEAMLWMDSELSALQLLRVADLNGFLLADLLAVQLGILVIIFGREYKGSGRSHSVQIVLGLAVAAITQMSLVGGWQALIKWALIPGQAEYERLMSLQDVLFNIASGVYVAVLVWWIVSLWLGATGERHRRRRRRSWQTAPAAAGDKPVLPVEFTMQGER